MMDALVCWKCGASIAQLPLPLVRLAECPSCHAELHICLMCQFYDPGVSHSCREPIAEEVKEKKRANFCGYFQVKPDVYRAQDQDAARAAQAELEALFGPGSAASGETHGDETKPGSEEDAAKRRLDDLFKK